MPLTAEPRVRRSRLNKGSGKLVCAAVRNAGRLRRLQEEKHREFHERVRLVMEATRHDLERAAARIAESERRADEMAAYADEVERRAVRAEQWLRRVVAERDGQARPAAIYLDP